jgi:protein-tyrosine phosphatase
MIYFILKRLAIGSFQDAEAKPRKITAFLNVAAEKDLGIEDRLCHKIWLQDFVPVPPAAIREAVDWIQTHIVNHTILVFCNAGVGRSSSVVVGYLVKMGFGFAEAVEFVASKKPDVSILPRLMETIEESYPIALSKDRSREVDI